MNGGKISYYEFGKFRLEPAERLLIREDRPVPLPPRTFDTLVALVEKNGHLVEKDHLLERVWHGSFVEEVNLTVHISALRKALGTLDDGSGFIETVPKRGYRFAAPVREVESDEIEVARRFRLHAVQEEIETNDLANSRGQGSLIKAGPLQRPVIIAAVACLLLTTLLVLTYTMSRQPRDFSRYNWKPLSSDSKTGMALISPNGEFLVYFQLSDRGDSIKIRRLGGDEAITIVPEVTVPCWGFALSHDNNFLYYVLADHPSELQGGTLYRVSILGGPPKKILDGITVAPTLSPDDRRVGFMRNGKPGISMLMTANAEDGSDERVVSSSETQDALWNPQWSPDGKKFVCFIREKHNDGNCYSLVEIPAEGGGIRKITQPSARYIWWHTWLHDGTGLVAIRSDEVTGLRQLIFVSYPDGAIKKVSNDLNQYAGISLSDDATKVVTDENERRAGIVIGNGDGRNANELKLEPCCPTGVTWISDKQLVFDGFADGKRALWTIRSDGSGQQKLSPTNAQDWAPSPAPYGGDVVFLSTRSGSKQIWKSGTDGRDPVKLSEVGFDIDRPRYSPDGASIYFSMLADGKWKVARINSGGGGEPEVVLDENTSVWDVSPNGRAIAYAFWPTGAQNEIVAVANIETREVENRFDLSPKDILRWTRDGRQLIYEITDPKNSTGSVLGRVNVAASGPQPTPIESALIDYDLDQSPDGSSFAYIRGNEVSNLVMLSAN